MTIWPPQKQDLKRPVYLSLASAMLRAMRLGELTGGDRLPTHRELAYQLDVSVQTVSRAYDELTRIGAISGQIGRGTFVTGNLAEGTSPHFYLPEDQRSSLIDLSILKPVCDQIHIDHMRNALLALTESLPAQVVYSFRPANATHAYDATARKWLNHCGLDLHNQSALITNGNTAAMTVALMTLANPGDMVVTEEIGHHTLVPLARYLGIRLKGLSMDAQGIEPSAFQAACTKQTVKALFLMPSGVGPRLSVMSLARRLELIRIARMHDVFIIESDAWGPLQSDRPTPFAMLAPERTLYFTSLTKCLMPGLRVGYLVVPDSLSAAARNRHLVTNWMATSMMVEIASRWIEDGTAETLVNWQIKAAAHRNRIAADVLQDVTFLNTPTGLHVWLPLGARNETEFVATARQTGVAVAPGASFSIGAPPHEGAVRICLGGVPETELTQGLLAIRQLVLSQNEPILQPM
ncbi:MAG: PLP-dependent aminotransferase family protein [Albidovulum sp.]